MAITDLAARLKELRGEQTQVEVARALGVSPALISAWENAGAVPPPQRLTQYAELYGEPGLFDQLQQMRSRLVGASRHDEEDVGVRVLAILQDMRWLLVQIRDRLPPPQHG